MKGRRDRVNNRIERDWADHGAFRKDGTPMNTCHGCGAPIRTYVERCTACRARLDAFWRGLNEELAEGRSRRLAAAFADGSGR